MFVNPNSCKYICINILCLMKKTRIKKIGNSHGVIIPKDILAKANISERVVITAENNRIIISADAELTINESLQRDLEGFEVYVLEKNVLSFKGIEIALNDEQIVNLNNQYINERM